MVLSIDAMKPDPTSKPLTETIPVTTLVEVPVLSDAERAAFVASLHEAEADIREGRATELSADEFDGWLTSRARNIRACKSKHCV